MTFATGCWLQSGTYFQVSLSVVGFALVAIEGYEHANFSFCQRTVCSNGFILMHICNGNEACDGTEDKFKKIVLWKIRNGCVSLHFLIKCHGWTGGTGMQRGICIRKRTREIRLKFCCYDISVFLYIKWRQKRRQIKKRSRKCFIWTRYI